MPNNDKQIQCRGCKGSKTQNEFYLIDGGLQIEGIENLRFEVCKECVSAYNTKNGESKFCYFLWQHIACYYGAKKFITTHSDIHSCDKQLLKTITSNISNGYKTYIDNNSTSLEMALQNFISLFNANQKGGLKNASKRQKGVFDKLQKVNMQADLQNAIQEILQEDYKTFAQFQQKQGME